jgi:ribosome recycling factor
MEKSISFFEGELKSLQIGRASAWLVEGIEVEASYWRMKIPQIWHVTLMDAQTIKIEPWDKNELKHIEKAIYDSNSWLTPKNEWSYIMIKIPALTQERRQEIVKQIKAMWEEIKARIRLVRQDALKESKKIFDAKEIWEDEHKRNEKEVDSIVKSMNEKVDDHIKAKSEEVLKV